MRWTARIPRCSSISKTLFRTMRQEWGVTYFKLDANFWGMMHGGRLHDPKATRVEAYRRGMEAIRRGAGDGFILGCNHPIWASFGLIHGSRSSNDIKRSWDRVASIARQNLSRNWQNGRLWWNDPDAVVLTGGDLTLDEFLFHAASIYACGGMVLSGDDLIEAAAGPHGAARETAAADRRRRGVRRRLADRRRDARRAARIECGASGASAAPVNRALAPRTYVVFNWENDGEGDDGEAGRRLRADRFLDRRRSGPPPRRLHDRSDGAALGALLICRPVN